MTYTVYVVIEDEDGTHVKEWGLNNSENLEEAEECADAVVESWYDRSGIVGWEVE